MKEHWIKCWPEYLSRVQSGQKKFEIRENDRDYQVGDILYLQPFDPVTKEYTCAECAKVKVTYMTSFAQQEGYVVMGIELEQ